MEKRNWKSGRVWLNALTSKVSDPLWSVGSNPTSSSNTLDI